MTLKTITRKEVALISQEAHRAAYAAGSMFLEKHDFKQGRTDGGLYITHGYLNAEEEMVPLTKLVVGAKLRNKQALQHVSARKVANLLCQSFVGNNMWTTADIDVSVKRFMEPINAFLIKHEEHLDVFAGIYENKLTSTNVFGIYIMLKDVEKDEQRLNWEITIDHHDLVAPNSMHSVFRS